ncbi:GDSL esterase/lipase EXL3-like protein [Cinnamomum micranthum f. kanehirae]|uniref:GDSL esterase/lipase EXL3-like protein n=1 Tax=Cinnamomum micranthum f. kanehirae TaxID=337451 RepID=A0A443PNM4_9MAGN|nr:GDSL esterase/lipase EXL3-like protein [Cinnamomum micranthum f. kanehirae]
MTLKLFFFCFAPSFTSSSILSLLLFFLLVHIGFYGQTIDAKKPPVPALIVFGDSIVDPGNNNKLGTLVKCNFPPYGKDFTQHIPTGRFCNGKIPSDLLAASLGIKELVPAYLDPNLTPEDLLTGVSFASGGTGYDNLTARIVSVLSLSDQLELFKEYIGKLKSIAGEERAAIIVSESLYVSILGTDDIANTYFGTPFRRPQYDVSSYTDLVANSASDFYEELYNLGARKIGVVGLPPVGCVPSQRTLAGGITRDCVEHYNQVARLVNSKISNKLEMLSTKFSDPKILYIDIYTTLDDIIRRPFNYGFEVSNRGCCGTGNIEVSILCNPATPPCPDVSKYVFWDSYHPTEKAYKALIGPVIRDYLPRLV